MAFIPWYEDQNYEEEPVTADDGTSSVEILPGIDDDEDLGSLDDEEVEEHMERAVKLHYGRQM